MSFIDQIAELEKAKAKLAQAEAKLAADRTSALAKLPGDYGYASLNEFIKALTAAAGKAKKVKAAKAPKAAKAAKAAKAPKAAKAAKRGRTKITPELKAQVIAAVKADKSGAEIAKAFGISLPSVQNIKKEAGLVKSRTAAPEAVVAVEAPAAS